VASKDKPYRVYRGGRVKGPIRPEAEKERPRRRGRRDGEDPYAGGPGVKERRRRGRRWLRIGLILTIVLVLAALVWAVLGYLAFRSGVKEANDRLDSRVHRVLTPQDGSILSNPTTVLVLGTDEARNRQGPFRSDAMMLVRTDPDEHRIALLSIPRDLRVEIPGHDLEKINAAYAFGGPTLAVTTVKRLTGVPINHVVVMNFNDFRKVIDALGGVSINVPRKILSNPFDCPRKTKAECARFKGYRFAKGEQEMNGRRALIYARIRENQLNPRESDITRGQRQQDVLQAVADEVVGFRGYLRMPFIGDDLVKPLATDMSANQLIELGWVKFRAPDDGTIRCRLGGTIAVLGGISYILGSEENVSVVAMVTGESAPQPPPPGSGPYGAGCFVGRRPGSG
jgi:polyisoprenyl-teichoic acid--peptidoglycan teichoic acid transferase